MTAVRKVKAHKGFTWHKDSLQYSSVCLCTGVGLYVCILSTEQLLDACYCKALSLVNNLATTVVTLTWVAFCIFVGKA